MMQDQILQTLLRNGNQSGDHGHDGFWDGPGNPIQISPLYVTSQIAIAVPLGLTAFLTFCVLRTKWSHFYMALARERGNKLSSLPEGLLTWIPQIWKATDDQILDAAGLDAYVFLGFFKMSILFLVASSFIGLVIVMPIQSHFDPDGGWGNFTEFTPLTRTTIDIDKKPTEPENTSYLWAYLVFTYVFTILLSYFLVNQSRIVSKRRQEYLGSQSSVADRTIKISGIPHDLRDEKKLQNFVDKLRIGDVNAVTICRDWREIDELAAKRAATLRKLEEAYIVFEGQRIERDLQTLPVVQPTPEQTQRPASEASVESQPLLNGHRKPARRRPTFKTGPWGLMGKEVDAIDFYTAKLQLLDQTILEARKKEYPATPLAFVTFEKVASAQLAAQSVLDPTPLRLVAHLAPAPNDIVWPNTYTTHRQRIVRGWSITVVSGLVSLLWAIPIGALSGFLDPAYLERVLPAVADFFNSKSLVAAFVQGFLPTLMYTLFNGMAPFIFDWLSSWQGYISSADAELANVSKHFFYLFVNFIVYLIFGSLANIWALAKDTTQIAHIIAEKLPVFARFFINLIILQGVGMFPFRLLQFGPLFVYPFARVGCKTPRDFQELKTPAAFSFGMFLPQPILVLILCLSYSVMKPLILIAGLVYFCIGYFVYKYQLLYAMAHPQHSTGALWIMITRRVIVGMVFYQIAMIGLLSLRKAYLLSTLILPLPILTVFLLAYNIDHSFGPLMRFIALRSLRERRRRMSQSLDEERESGTSYVNPNLVAELEPVWTPTRTFRVYEEDRNDGSSEGEV